MSSASVKVDVRHSAFPGRRWAELKLHLDTPILSVKDKLFSHTDGCELHIEDTSSGGATAVAAEADALVASGDLSAKYRMPEEEYDKRDGTMRKFLRTLKETRPDLFKEDPTPNEAQLRTQFPIGARCELIGGRRGTVAFVGRRPSRPPHEIWIGVALDEPQGSTDGRDAKRVANNSACVEHRLTGPVLFECKGENYGEFVLPDHCSVGDYPELDPFDLVDEI